MDIDPVIASNKLQTNLIAIQNWFKKWIVKANGFKSIHVTFTTRKENVPPSPGSYKLCVAAQIDVGYFLLYFDRRLIRPEHIFVKR
jgi:hypothetical protein